MTLKIVSLRLAALSTVLFAPAQAAVARSVLTIPPATVIAMRIVAMHNQVRAAAGSPPIYWDSALALAADRYAAELARTGRWGHSPPATRIGQGENLWMGTRGAFTIEQMLGAWVAEGRAFRPGRFPDVSRNSSWKNVGHFTQMIWPYSVRVGCALRSSARFDYFVCRYSPAGNVTGVTVP